MTNALRRLQDANANRCAEGLRVCEDVARFLLNNKELSARLKTLRHDLAAVCQIISTDFLVDRDTAGDVGTTNQTQREYQRSSLAELIQANAKRAQESLRCLEETAKMDLDSAAIAQRFEQIRYKVYDLERDFLAALNIEKMWAEKLYALIDTGSVSDPLAAADALLCAGVKIIQYRAKAESAAQYAVTAREILQRCQAFDALFIVNDHVAVAAAIGADGIHVGQEDLRCNDVRSVVGPMMLIGLSVHTFEQYQHALLLHQQGVCDYIGLGPMFSTQTKAHEPVRGPSLLTDITRGHELPMPSYAIGGINAERITELRAQLPHGVAVASYLTSDDFVEQNVAACRAAFRLLN